MTNYEYRGNRRSGSYTLYKGVDPYFLRWLLDLATLVMRNLYIIPLSTFELSEHQRWTGRIILKGVNETILGVYYETV
jgi:hypothetical protein